MVAFALGRPNIRLLCDACSSLVISIVRMRIALDLLIKVQAGAFVLPWVPGRFQCIGSKCGTCLATAGLQKPSLLLSFQPQLKQAHTKSQVTMGAWNSKLQSTDLSSLSEFAIEAVGQLHEDAAAVSKEKGTKGFVCSLRAELFNVNESLQELGSLLDGGNVGDRTLMVLDNLERLCQVLPRSSAPGALARRSRLWNKLCSAFALS
jgi:hypothetical protein